LDEQPNKGRETMLMLIDGQQAETLLPMLAQAVAQPLGKKLKSPLPVLRNMI
jgi:hypothetical protein